MTLIAGYITKEEAETDQPTIGIEFDAESNQVVLYFDEGQGSNDFPLTYEQVQQLRAEVAQVQGEMEWHMAAWVYAHAVASNTYHLMKKGEHSKTGECLCGQKPRYYASIQYTSEWDLVPVIHEPRRTSTCKKCLAIYEKHH